MHGLPLAPPSPYSARPFYPSNFPVQVQRLLVAEGGAAARDSSGKVFFREVAPLVVGPTESPHNIPSHIL